MGFSIVKKIPVASRQCFGTNLPLTLPENMVGGSCNDGMMVSQDSHVINAPQKNGAASRRNAYRGS